MTADFVTLGGLRRGVARRVLRHAPVLLLAAMTAACAGQPMTGAVASLRDAASAPAPAPARAPAPATASMPLAATPMPVTATYMTVAGGVPSMPAISSQAIDAVAAPCRMRIGYRMSGDRRTAFVHIDGVMADACAHRIVAMFGRLDRDYPSSQPVLVVNSPGGSIAWAEMLAKVVLQVGLPVVIPPHSMCASACFLVLAASPLKIVAASAHVGVHSVSVASGRETIATEAVTTQIARDCAALGVPSEIIGHMIVTRPGAIYWLSPAELASMGARLVPS